jgi:hypothetical protein
MATQLLQRSVGGVVLSAAAPRLQRVGLIAKAMGDEGLPFVHSAPPEPIEYHLMMFTGATCIWASDGSFHACSGRQTLLPVQQPGGSAGRCPAAMLHAALHRGAATCSCTYLLLQASVQQAPTQESERKLWGGRFTGKTDPLMEKARRKML